MEGNRPRRYKSRNQKRKFRWIGHTLRKEDGEIPKAALLWNPQGSRKRGRPKTSWRRSVIKEVGRSWNKLRFLAADKTEVERAHRQPMFLKEQWTLLYCVFFTYISISRDPLSDTGDTNAYI
jgi:hypothetical protein